MRPSGSPMPGVGATVGRAAATGSCAGEALAASGLFGFWANPAGGAVGWVAAGAVAAGELAGACAAAGVSHAAAKAIAHPIRLISTPGHLLEPINAGARHRDCPLYRRGFCEPQAPASIIARAVLKGTFARPKCRLAMMSDDDILAEFRAAEALLEGHFILSSGLRSPRYLQCARVLMDPARAERLARALAET